MPDLSLVLGLKETLTALRPPRDGRESAARGVSGPRFAFVPAAGAARLLGLSEARRRAVPRPAPSPTSASAPRGGASAAAPARPPGPTQRPGSRPWRGGPARPGPGLTPPLRRLQPRPRSPTAEPRPVAATAAIAPLAAAVSPAPAALTALTPPSTAVNPTRGRQAIPTLCDSVSARARGRAPTRFPAVPGTHDVELHF